MKPFLYGLSAESEFKLPLLDDAYKIEENQYIDIVLDSCALLYYVTYPSGYSKEFRETYLLEAELGRFIPDIEKLTDTIRYATNWRHIAFYPHTQTSYIVFPDGRIGRGGYGNHN